MTVVLCQSAWSRVVEASYFAAQTPDEATAGI
jgi:hypothetical protein